MRFIVKHQDEAGNTITQGFDRLNEVSREMKRLTAYNRYFEVIHQQE